MPKYGHLVRCTADCENYVKDADYTVGLNITEHEANRVFSEHPKCWTVLRFNSKFKDKNPKPKSKASKEKVEDTVDEPVQSDVADVTEQIEIPEVKTTGLKSPGKTYKPAWSSHNLSDKDD